MIAERNCQRGLTLEGKKVLRVSRRLEAPAATSLTKKLRSWTGQWLLAALASLLLFACDVELVRNLGEHEANRVVSELNQKNIGSRKSSDPDNEGRFQVTVAGDDIAPALGALSARGLPSKEVPGLLESMGESGLVPSRASEHARFVQGTAGELERTLYELDGVVTARVHLALPTPDPLAIDKDTRPTTGSVLVRHRGASPPVAATEVQRLVAGAVSGLKPDGVSVVFIPITTDAPVADSLTQVAAFSVTKSSANYLRIALGGAALLNVLLVGGVVLLWLRSKQAKPQPSS